MIKKSISVILSLIMALSVFALVPYSAQAKEESGSIKNVKSSSNAKVEANNAVGSLIADAVNEEQQKDVGEDDLENKITDVTVEGNSADVEFYSSDKCKIVVGIFDEEGKVMLASGIAEDLDKDSKNVKVNINTATMPEYFYVKAFILDEDNHPLGESFESNYYTSAFQSFLSKTTDDFDSDLVYNLDGDKKNNFAVFDESTEEVAAGSYTQSGDTYTFTNPSDEIKLLKTGDIFYYTDNDGEIVIIKVKTIEINNNTAIITNDTDLKLDDVFSYVKIDTEGNPDEASLDTSEADEGVTLKSSKSGKTKHQTGVDGEYSFSSEKTFSIGIAKQSGKDFEKSITGSADVTVGFSLSIFYSDVPVEGGKGIWEISFITKGSIGGSIKISAKITKSFLKIGRINFPTQVPSVFVGMDADIVFEATATLEANYKASCQLGFKYDSFNGLKNMCKLPSGSAETKIDGELFVGLRLAPDIKALWGFVETSMPIDFGERIKGEYIITETDTEPKEEDAEHLCDWCIDGDISIILDCKLELKTKGKIANSIISATLFNREKKINDFYYSSDLGFGFGTCPNRGFIIKACVVDKYKNPISGAAVNDQITDSRGMAEFKVKSGSYSLIASKEGYKTAYLSFDVTKNQTYLMTLYYNDDKVNNVNPDSINGDSMNVDDIPTGGDVELHFNRNGTIVVSGSGELNHVPSEYSYYSENIGNIIITTKRVVIGKGITSIKSGAFKTLTGLTSITIPSSVTSIGDAAFYRCTSLRSVSIDKGVKKIGAEAFEGCTQLNSITIPNSVESIGSCAFSHCTKLSYATIPGGVKELFGTFAYCTNLKDVTISNGVKVIGHGTDHYWDEEEIDNNDYISPDCGVFENCTSLKNITIPDSVTKIDFGAFCCCTSLKSVTIGKNVEIINHSFEKCTSLESITVPDSVRYLDGAFRECDNLKKVVLGKNVEEISWTFENCINLKEITIPDSVIEMVGTFKNCTSINNIILPKNVKVVGSTFYGCQNLESISIPDSLTVIGYYMFEGCTNLKSVTIPDSVTKIGVRAFYGCTSLKSITIPCSVTNIYEIAFGYYYYNPDSRAKKLDGFTIYGYSGSEAEKYAKDNGFNFIDISKSVTRAKASKAMTGSDDSDLKTHTVKKSGLAPNAQYTLLVFDSEAQGNLSSDKLLYIAQAEADDEGKVEFTIYDNFGDTYWEAYVLGACAHNHTHTETVNFPTETDEGLEVTVCDDCDKVIDSEILEKLPEETEPTEDSTQSTEPAESTETTQPTEYTEPTNATQATENTGYTWATEPTDTTQPVSQQPATPVPKLNKTKVSLKAGGTVALKVSGGTVKSWLSSNKKVATVSKGKIIALKKGTTTITAKLSTGKKLTCKINVTTSPKLSKPSVTVTKGKTVKVKITGKAKTVNNVYKNTKVARIASKKSATSIYVKGLKKGKTTLKIIVNGVVLKLKVKVK